MKNKYLIFNIGNQKFGIDVKNIMFIKTYNDEIENLNSLQKETLSIFKYRSKIIPLLNPQKYLSSEINITENKHIVILEKNEIFKSVLVNQVSNVVELNSEEIYEQNGFCANFVKGFYESTNGLVTIIDLEKTLIFENE